VVLSARKAEPALEPRPEPEPDESEPGLDCVVPLVRADADWEEKADPSAPVIEVLAGSLVVVYAFDEDTQFRMVAQRDLVRLGVDRAALSEAAHDHLLDRMADLQLLDRPDGCGMVRLDGNLESSAILVPELWHDIGEILGDEVLVAVPARDIVLFCGAGNDAVKRALRAARDRALAVGDHKITGDLFRFHGGSWQVEPA
jgi:uncharacterized protein YtpQ (UPF0354 family)